MWVKRIFPHPRKEDRMPNHFGLRPSRLLPTTCALAASVMLVIAFGGFAGASGGGLGIPHPAGGSPLTIGMITDAGGSGGVGTSALVEAGAKMAVSYANAYEKGLDGHKINLYICENQNSPAGGQTCANDMVQKGVVAVVEPFTGQGATEVPTITKAGIPYITLSGASEAELTTPGAFDLTGGFPAILGGIALQAKSKGYKKVGFLVENVPAAIQGAQVLGGLVFKAAGVGFEVIPVNVGTADMTPQLQSAISGGADAVGMVGDVTFCSSFLQAYDTLASSVPKYVLSTCFDPSILNSPTLDKALKGSYVATSAPSAQERALYAAMTKKYSPKTNPNPDISSNNVSGVTPVLALLGIMKGYSGPVTAAAILQQTEAAKNVVLPLSGGITFTCNGAAIPLLKSVCSAATSLGVVGKGVSVSHVKTYNPTPLF
jgi:branched-chain amino acid transport system substrate-binding protein